MFEALFGNKTIEKVLLFLLVNKKSYPSQISKMLNIALTPIQKALEKLEKGDVVMRCFEGKIKIFQFNPKFPLIHELENLLKKAFSCLSTEEKRVYYYIRDVYETPKEENIEALLELWKKLHTIRTMQFQAQSTFDSQKKWQGLGKGQVYTEQEEYNGLIFRERGYWQEEKNQKLHFSNIFRWTLNRLERFIALEHLRYGRHNSVFLFHLAAKTKDTFESIDTYLCGKDTYFGKVYLTHSGFEFNWRILGPKKNEEIKYIYSS